MKNTKHTPGPWDISDNRILGDRGSHYRNVIATLGKENLEANARLIATAPELLKALKQLRIDISIRQQNTDDMALREWCSKKMEQCLAVIAKAEGNNE